MPRGLLSLQAFLEALGKARRGSNLRRLFQAAGKALPQVPFLPAGGAEQQVLMQGRLLWRRQSLIQRERHLFC